MLSKVQLGLRYFTLTFQFEYIPFMYEIKLEQNFK